MAEPAAGADSGPSLGKGAWDCDNNREIPPEKEAEVFEELATMEHSFEGIPTIPPRKDTAHMAFYCNGCRYRVAATPDMTVAQVKQALWAGGIARVNKAPEQSSTPGMKDWSDLALLYAMQVMEDDQPLAAYHVPPGCKVMVAIEAAKLSAPQDPDSAYWN
uniref:Ubiquitin-like domain-containing protein n=1 Tax=Tetradesmus obliquus TaxID=3088 RepID=A0A383WL67_TETOB|eukprot:jgi/Sobl393_1/8413/SZX77993.1